MFSSTGSGDEKSYGKTRYYKFEVPGSNLRAASSFKVVAPGIREASFPISAGPFIVPSLTSSTNQNVSFVVAIPQGWDNESHQDLSLRIVAPVPQPLTLGPTFIEGVANRSTSSGLKSGFDFWTGTYEIVDGVTGSVSLSLLEGGGMVDRLILNGGIGGW